MVRLSDRLRGRIGLSALFLLGTIVIPPPSPGSLGGGSGGEHLLHLPTLCLFRLLTSLPCPACGITRSLVCATHGREVESFRYHPLGWVVLIVLLYDVLRRLGLLPSLTPQIAKRAWQIGVVILFACWIARLVGWFPAPPL